MPLQPIAPGDFTKVAVGIDRPEDVVIAKDGRVFASDHQCAVAEILPRAAQVVGLQQQALYRGQQRLAGWREPRQAFAGAHEDLHPQLFFQLADLAADARLRGVQQVRHFGQVEAPSARLAHRAQLLEIHKNTKKI